MLYMYVCIGPIDILSLKVIFYRSHIYLKCPHTVSSPQNTTTFPIVYIRVLSTHQLSDVAFDIEVFTQMTFRL